MKTFENAQIDAVADHLKMLGSAPKTDKPLTVREAIEKLKPQLLAAQKKGWDFVQLANVLKGQGIVVLPDTLKRYIRTSGKQPAKPSSSRVKTASRPRVEPVSVQAGGHNSGRITDNVGDESGMNFGQTNSM